MERGSIYALNDLETEAQLSEIRGRPSLPPNLRQIIRQFGRENPTWERRESPTNCSSSSESESRLIIQLNHCNVAMRNEFRWIGAEFPIGAVATIPMVFVFIRNAVRLPLESAVDFAGILGRLSPNTKRLEPGLPSRRTLRTKHPQSDEGERRTARFVSRRRRIPW